MDVASWAALLSRVGAEPKDWVSVPGNDEGGASWRVELRTRGIEVDIDQVEIDIAAGVFTYRGQQITIYIKDTRKPADVLVRKEDAVRFHVTDCDTIRKMKEQNRYQRYVAIARTDARFPVFSRELDGTRQDLEVELAVCKNCLTQLDYDSYRAETARRARIWSTFSIEAFFKQFSSTISIIPRDSCNALPDSLYTHDWQQRSREIRERAKWICSSCRVDLSEHRQLLHVHHRDRDKSNNRLSNLIPLCVVCHAAEPGHSGMFVHSSARSTITELRTKLASGRK